VRHAEPKLVTISIERYRDPERGCDEVRLAVTDDGRGMREPDRLGYGLVGISERVRAMGGRLSFSNRSEGFAMVATLPYPPVPDPVSSAVQVAEP
jgi:two-component system sensor histidine kinase UhpB